MGRQESRLPGRWLTASVALHAMLVVAALVLPARMARMPKPPGPVDVVIYRPAPPVSAPIPRPAPREPEIEPQPPRPAPKEPEPLSGPAARPHQPAALPQPEPRVVEPVSEIASAAPVPPRESAPAVERRLVRESTDAFALPAPSQPAAKPERAVARIGGFAPADPAPVTRMAKAPREVGVHSAGFASTAMPAERRPPTRTAGVVTLDASFDVAAVEEASPRPRSTSAVAAAGFGAAVDADPAAPSRKRAAENPETPVEILSKPLPVYTEEARRLRVEGEVVLEVTFLAAGELRVIRVVRGLGHGLDEAALVAAKKIEFKPARRDGRPVDHTAQLRVVFRLA